MCTTRLLVNLLVALFYRLTLLFNSAMCDRDLDICDLFLAYSSFLHLDWRLCAHQDAMSLQISTLVSHRERPLCSDRSLRAVARVGQAVNLAVERFVTVGETIADDNPEIKQDMYEACKEARVAGKKHKQCNAIIRIWQNNWNTDSFCYIIIIRIIFIRSIQDLIAYI